MKNNKQRKVTSNTGFKGIHLHKGKNKYEAKFNYKGHQTFLGTHSSLQEAVQARNNYILSLM